MLESKVETNELVITRVFDAAREKVWCAWTDAEHLKRWWGPKNFTAPVIQMDLRVGGKYLFCMKSPEGQEFWSTGIYRKIVPLALLVCSDSFADAAGNVVPATHYGMGLGFPLELQITLTLEEHESKTTMILRHDGMPAGKTGEMAETGWNESFDKLAATFTGPDRSF